MKPSLLSVLRHLCLLFISLATVTLLHSQALPPWAEADVGNTGARGSVVYDPNNFFSVFGSGFTNR
jgi:hypothetical protein